MCNIMTQHGTTGGWPASRFIQTVLGHLGGTGGLDCVIVNSAPLPEKLLAERAEQGSYPVASILEEICASLGPTSLCGLYPRSGRAAARPGEDGAHDTLPGRRALGSPGHGRKLSTPRR